MSPERDARHGSSRQKAPWTRLQRQTLACPTSWEVSFIKVRSLCWSKSMGQVPIIHKFTPHFDRPVPASAVPLVHRRTDCSQKQGPVNWLHRGPQGRMFCRVSEQFADALPTAAGLLGAEAAWNVSEWKWLHSNRSLFTKRGGCQIWPAPRRIR